MNNITQIRDETERKVFSILDAQSKDELRKRIIKEREKWKRDEKTKEGNKRIKAEIDRIKMTTPQKTLQAFLNLQMALEQFREDIPDELYDTISNLIASPDNDTNLFSCMTEMMAVCDYEETQIVSHKKWTYHREKSLGQKLTEAEKIIRANDPNDHCWTMCKMCKRCMTTAWYNRGHKGSFTCRRTIEAQALSLKHNQVYSLETGDDLAKIQIQTKEQLNASLGKIKVGVGDMKITDYLR